MFIRSHLISVILTISTLATYSRGPVVRLDDAVGHLSLQVPSGGYWYILDPKGFHWFNQWELDKVPGYPFHETTVCITHINLFSSCLDPGSAQEPGGSTFLSPTIHTATHSMQLHTGQFAHSRPLILCHLRGWIHKHSSSSLRFWPPCRVMRAKTVCTLFL